MAAKRVLPAQPPYYVSPKLHDAVCQDIQKKLIAELTWLELAYHIAKVGVYASEKVDYPQIHANDGTYKHFDIGPDEKVKMYCFFEIDKPSETDFTNDETSHFISIVFWGNLDNIDNSKQYDFTSELIKETIDLMIRWFEPINCVYDVRPERIFDKYNGVKQDLKQFMMKRYTGFKISFEIKTSFSDNC